MKAFRIFFLFVALFLFQLPVFAQQQLQPDSVGGFPGEFPKKEWLLTAFLKDEARLFTSPLRIKGKDLLVILPVTAATLLTIPHDEALYAHFKKFQKKHDWVSTVSPVITYGGDSNVNMIMAGMLYGGGWIAKNEKMKQTAMLSAIALGHAGVIIVVTKLAAGRCRPSYDQGRDHWYSFPASLGEVLHGDPRQKYDAMPSGHTISAFTMASVIAHQYRDKPVIPIIAYSLATGAALSRVTEDTHWCSDLIAGAALGYGIGRYVVKNHPNTKWTVLPTGSTKNVYLTGIYRF
jgi:membrane-associated phospholipid phosphatase